MTVEPETSTWNGGRTVVFSDEGDGWVIEQKYHGAGYALAAHDGARVLDLIYLGDVLPDFDLPDGPPSAQADRLQAVLLDDRLRPAIEQLRPQGTVSIGMCSCYEFVEL